MVWHVEDIRFERGHVPVVLNHLSTCHRENYPVGSYGLGYAEIFTARLFDVCFEAWGGQCCYRPDRSPSGLAYYVEGWCGLRLVEVEDVDRLLGEIGAPPRWESHWHVALPAVFHTARKSFYLAADVLRIETVRRGLKCRVCRVPFGRWEAAGRVALARCDHDEHTTFAWCYCSTACRDEQHAQFARESEARRVAQERRDLREAQRLLKETQRVATDPAYRRAKQAADQRRREAEARRKVVPMSKEV